MITSSDVCKKFLNLSSAARKLSPCCCPAQHKPSWRCAYHSSLGGCPMEDGDIPSSSIACIQGISVYRTFIRKKKRKKVALEKILSVAKVATEFSSEKFFRGEPPVSVRERLLKCSTVELVPKKDADFAASMHQVSPGSPVLGKRSTMDESNMDEAYPVLKRTKTNLVVPV